MKSVAIILAGGYGSRLWPISTSKFPKQFGYYYGDGSMLLNTYNRLLNFFPKEDIFIVSQSFFFDKIIDQIPEFEVSNLILEPYVRSTAAALSLSNIFLRKRYPEDTVLFAFPSDQKISNMHEFGISIENAAESASVLPAIITLGIIPTHPETQFGYIQIDDDTFDYPELYEKDLRYVLTFAEKPDFGTAQRFVAAGDFIWNSGIFVLQLKTLTSELKKNLPEHYSAFENLFVHLDKPEFASQLDATYRSISTQSFDYGVLEKSTNVYCILSKFDWSDYGTWDEVYRQSLKDTKENYLNGEIIPIDTKNCIVVSKDRLVATIGIRDLIIIESEQATLVCKRGESPQVKKIIDYLRSKGIKEYL
jgi:mannose-1-phosphate guanylyltransferase